MKPLEKGRNALIWMGIHFADDEPVSQQLKLARKSSAAAFAFIFIVIATMHVIMFIEVRLINNPEEFFIVLLQLVTSIYESAGFITIYVYGSRISIVFQSLAQIYEKCK